MTEGRETREESEQPRASPPSGTRPIKRVFVTGATGFVGRYVVKELLTRGFTPVCLVRSQARLAQAAHDLDRNRIAGVVGTVFDRAALGEAAAQCDAAIHLVGIIREHRLKGQTFDRIHRRGTLNVVEAVKQAGIKRYVHMSALGARPDALSAYHRTKHAAEQCIKESGLDWTIFQPSVIHGYDGEFMELMKTLACSLIPPVMPYFGKGENRLQPVSVKDVAFCFVDALRRDETVGWSYALGGPKSYSWKELYAVCRKLIPGAKRWKPLISQPVPIAKLLAVTVMKTPLVPSRLKFNLAQVQMSQEDSVCGTETVESAFQIRLRNFENELSRYAELIR
ncbi:MAG: NAD(P)H-binding protein [Phycisphaerae bacterium]